MIVTTPTGDVPGELSDDAVRITLDGPNLEELDEILSGLEETQGLRNELSADGRARMLQAAVGLSANEALRCFSKVIIRDGV